MSDPSTEIRILRCERSRLHARPSPHEDGPRTDSLSDMASGTPIGSSSRRETSSACSAGGSASNPGSIPMPCPGPDQEDYIPPVPPPDGNGRILWIGRIDRVKRPDRFLDVVEACPDLEFDLVGPAGGDPYAREISERAACYPNLRVHGGVPRDDVPMYYRKAACLCSTSDVEGFPNTFLEAWSYGIPVVSTIDPDDLILEKGLGSVARNVPELVAATSGNDGVTGKLDRDVQPGAGLFSRNAPRIQGDATDGTSFPRNPLLPVRQLTEGAHDREWQ